MNTVALLLGINAFLLLTLIFGVAFLGLQYFEDRKEVKKKNEEFEEEVVKPIEEDAKKWMENQDPEKLDSFMAGDMSALADMDFSGLSNIGAGNNADLIGNLAQSNLFKPLLNTMISNDALETFAQAFGLPQGSAYAIKPLAVEAASSLTMLGAKWLTNSLFSRGINKEKQNRDLTETKKAKKRKKPSPYQQPGRIHF